MPFARSQILDHGTANPIVARLTVQVFEILDQCEVTPEPRDAIEEIYMNSLAKKLLRCWEIVERYRAEFNKQIGSYERPEVHSQMVAAPYVMRLEEECHNFLYEAKSFIRDVLKAFNLLYGTGFVEGSEFFGRKGQAVLNRFC
jgi:hypothetical protein